MRSRSRDLVSVAIVAVLVVLLLLASCTSASEPSAKPETAATASKPSARPETAATPSKPYGSLKIAPTGITGGAIDPKIGQSVMFNYVGEAIFDSLLNYDPDADKYIPGIAERWEIADDGLSHTFYIRKGVKFHDGSDLTGDDVKFSAERMMSPGSVAVDAPTWRSTIARVELKDNYTVVFHLKKSVFELLTGLAYAGTGAITPMKYIEEKGEEYFKSQLVGSGPWKFVRWEPGNVVELEAVESHWRAVPKFKNLTLLNVKEEASKVAMLKTGELDVAAVSPDSVPGLKAAGLRVLAWEGGSQYWARVYYDVNNPRNNALGDVRVRKAVQLAINQRELADKMLGGLGAPYALFGTGPAAYFWDANLLKPDPYDPEGAKKLIAEAGYAKGFDLNIWDTGGGSLLSTISTAFAGYLQRIGINVTIKPIELATLNPMRFTPQVWDSIQPGLAGERPGTEQFMYSYHSVRGAARNFKDPKMDILLEKLEATKDPNERKRLALEIAVMGKNAYTALSIVGAHTILAVGPKIGEYSPGRRKELIAVMYENIPHAK